MMERSAITGRRSLNSAFDNAVAARLDDGWGRCPAVALRFTAGYALCRR
ncbi:MAG: hypothetical protein LBQ50_10020 [Planctomycetaceae bacterium]|nr:hypothetical protein [Planctomycetaceae bacterium]